MANSQFLPHLLYLLYQHLSLVLAELVCPPVYYDQTEVDSNRFGSWHRAKAGTLIAFSAVCETFVLTG